MGKPRLRLQRTGWFRYWTTYRLNSGVQVCEIWVGPYPTFEEAYRRAISDAL